jgi:hypothetical protein
LASLMILPPDIPITCILSQCYLCE